MVRVANLKALNYQPKTVATPEELLLAQQMIAEIVIPGELMMDAAKLVVAVRKHKSVEAAESVLSGSRPMLGLLDFGRIVAFSANRVVVTKEDIALAAPYVLSHRVTVTHEADDNQISARDIINAIA